MTIRSIVCCDACATNLIASGDEYRRDLVNRAHDTGWVSINRGGRWQNLCPSHETGGAAA